jgi:hypothetical protein
MSARERAGLWPGRDAERSAAGQIIENALYLRPANRTTPTRPTPVQHSSCTFSSTVTTSSHAATGPLDLL